MLLKPLRDPPEEPLYIPTDALGDLQADKKLPKLVVEPFLIDVGQLLDGFQTISGWGVYMFCAEFRNQTDNKNTT